ncbi:MAG TPA: LuxR C-terminal-related transcriptional regulator [Candidatus Baltobacteraceae bacterium]|nr:LuxR C-terminal-related transcriptional regulator [Candidatus Baltobacteraceae bacterium]
MIRPVRPDGKIETGGVFVPIVRRRVIDRIASAAMQRVVLIVAPAGYGKSVALRQYLGGLTDPHVCYDVLPDNAGLLGFLRGFADAIAEIAPDARSTLAGAYESNASAQSPGVDLALWMHSHLRAFRGVIAIDDLHVAQGDREVARFITSLIERTKSRVQWIIASRATTGLPIGTWLAYGESDLAIDEHDLKFSVEEAKEAARTFKLAVRDEEIFELLHLTDGWATALTFALRSTTRSVDLRNISSMTREMIYRYLAEQVYQTLSDEEQRFVETAALLPEFDIAVMVAAGFDRTLALIEDLRARVAFVHEYEPGRYRLHDLFRDFARREFERRGNEAQRQTLARLGGILEQMGRLPEALRLYVECGSAQDSLRLLAEHGIQLLDTGFADEVDFATSASPNLQYAADPAIVGLRGLLDLAGDRLGDAERKIMRALRSLDHGALCAELRLRLATDQCNRGQNVTELLSPVLSEETLPAAMRAYGQALIARCFARTNDSRRALALVADVERVIDSLDDDQWRSRLLLQLSMVYETMHEMEVARLMNVRAAELSSRIALWSVASRSNRNLSLIALMHDNDSASSLWFAQQAAAAATRAGNYADLQYALVMILSLETRRGNADRTAQIEKQLAEFNGGEGIKRADYIASSQAHRHAWVGRYADAHRLFGSVLDRQFHAPDRALVRACYALCLALDGQTKESGAAVGKALAIIDEQAGAPGAYGAMFFDFALLLLVLAEVLAGRHTYAQRLLKHDRQSSHEAVSCMLRAVEEIARAARTPSYALDDLEPSLEALREFGFAGYGHYLRNVADQLERHHEPETSIALTPSELRVVRDLAAGLTPKQIAAEMGRSVYTVQTHIQNLIEKFGCHGRAEAIAAARRSGLLDEI